MRTLIALLLSTLSLLASPNTMQGVQFCPLRLNAPTNASVQAWYDPNSPLNTLNGAGMSQLYDQTGLGHNLDQSTAVSQPLLSRADNSGNIAKQSQDFSNASVWSGSGTAFTITPVTSYYPGGTAYQLDNTGVTGSHALIQVTDSKWDGSALFVEILYEQVNAADCYVGLASGGFAGLAKYDLAAETAIIVVGSGTATFTKLTNTGPNGGKFAKLRLEATGAAGGNIDVYIYATGTSINTDSAILHSCQVSKSSWSSDYIATTATPAYPGQNGQRVLVFDGTDDYLKTATFPLVQPTTVVGVFEQVSFSDVDCIFDGFSASTLELVQLDPSPRIYAYAGTVLGPSTDLGIGRYGVVTVAFNGANSSLTTDNLTPVTGNVGSANGNGLTLGAFPTGSGPSNIKTADLLLLNRTLTTSEQSYLVQGLARKAGVNVW